MKFWFWFWSVIPAVFVQLELSQDDLRVLLRILMENLKEAGGPDPSAPRQETSLHVPSTRSPPTGLTPALFLSLTCAALCRFLSLMFPGFYLFR